MDSSYLCVPLCSIEAYEIKSACVFILDILHSTCSMEVEISPFEIKESISS